jgi:hypothetical protein
MTPDDKAHVKETQERFEKTPSRQLSPRAAMLEGGMMIFNALTRGDTANSIVVAGWFRLIAEWLIDSVRERMSADQAYAELVDVVNGILGERR